MECHPPADVRRVAMATRAVVEPISKMQLSALNTPVFLLSRRAPECVDWPAAERRDGRAEFIPLISPIELCRSY